MAARRAYFICDSIKDAQGRYVPCIATEDEPGYHKTDYDYGDDRGIAQEAVDSINADLGLTPEEAAVVVARSMGAQRGQQGEGSFRMAA